MGKTIDKVAQDFLKAIKNNQEKATKPYDTTATVLRVDGDIAWVHIPGGVEETPVQRTTNAKRGDTVQVRVGGGKAWLTGNTTNPPTDDTKANTAYIHAEKAYEKATTAEEDAKRAYDAANQAEQDAQRANDAAERAEDAADSAQNSADSAIRGLSMVESVVGTLEWLTEHSVVTDDTTVNPNKTYYIKNQDNTFTKVENPTGNPHSQGWYEMDEAVANYVAAHMALVDNGLVLKLDASSYRIHIGLDPYTGAADTDGVYILDGSGNIISYFGENITFSADTPQYIGNNSAYIVFDPSDGGSITIGGANIVLGDSRTLDEVVQGFDNTLIYDHTYEYVRDNNNVPIQANFTAFLYRGGVDVKTDPEFGPSCFTWYIKTEDGEVPLIPTGIDPETGQESTRVDNTGYTTWVHLNECGYGAEVVGKFTSLDDAEALTDDADNLTTVDDDPITVRASGDSVRVRDLTTSSTIFPTDKLMVIGSEDEHLVSIETLTNYLSTQIDSDKHYTHIQSITSDLWEITHNLDKYPSVSVVDSAGSVVVGDVEYVSTNALTITFGAAFKGKAFLN